MNGRCKWAVCQGLVVGAMFCAFLVRLCLEWVASISHIRVTG